MLKNTRSSNFSINSLTIMVFIILPFFNITFSKANSKALQKSITNSENNKGYNNNILKDNKQIEETNLDANTSSLKKSNLVYQSLLK